MEASDITVTIKASDLADLIAKCNEAERLAKTYHTMLVEEREVHKNYKAAEAEREANIRKQNEREYERRAKVLELNERKVNAYQDYHNAYGIALNAIKNILCDRITKKDDAKLKPHLDRIKEAWQEFDKIQKEVAKEIPPPSYKDSICEDCAAKMGKVPVSRPVGHWAGYCDFCGQKKSLSSLSHDYVDKEGARE